MDWQAAIDRQGVTLRRIVSTLVAMVGRGTGADLRAPGATAADRPTLARKRHCALMRVVRPAEAAARRLIIALALTVYRPQAAAEGAAAPTLPRPPKRRPRRLYWPKTPVPASTSLATGTRSGIVIQHLPGAHPTFGLAVSPFAPAAPAGLPAWARPPEPKPPRLLRLPLTDPVRRPKRRRRSSPRNRPSISMPGDSYLPRPPAYRPPQPDDRLDATRLVLRIEALADALDDLPGEAKRFLRWHDRRAAERARDRQAEALARDPEGIAPGETPAAHVRRMARRFRRIGPLRIGRPPGGWKRRNDELLALRDELQWLAAQALARHDTS